MTIQYFCGRPGSGKSYGVIENVLIPALKINRPIFTNIPLNLPDIAKDYPGGYSNITVFDNEDVNGGACPGEYLMTIPGGALIIIDECWRWWASGVKVNDIPDLDKEFFAEHRHKVGEAGLTQEIVLVSQAPSQIAKYLRDLIDQTVLTVKNNGAGSEKTFTVKIYSACIPSIDRPGEAQTSGLGTYKPSIYKYYKSHTKTETGLPGVEIRADKRLNVWSHWYIRYVAPLVLIGAGWGVYTFYDLYQNKFNKSNPVKSVPAPAPVLAPAPVNPAYPVAVAQVLPVVVPVVYSKRYRVAGQIAFDGKLKVYIHDANAKHMVIYDQTQCKTGEFHQTECKIDGELVTINTGFREAKKPSNNLLDVVPTIASNSVK
jgi:zona occludens toxin